MRDEISSPGFIHMKHDAGCSFVVFTTNRSGSVWVMSTLNALENVVAQGELFLPRKRAATKRWDSETAYTRFIEANSNRMVPRPFSVFSYLNGLYSMHGVVGFKLMYSQLKRYPEILLYLMRHSIRVVHLVRQNHLDVVISYAVKAKIGRAHLLSSDQAPRDTRIVIDTSSLLKQLTWLAKKQTMARRLLRSCKLQHLEIAYETLLLDKQNFDSICNFLSIDCSAKIPDSTVVKITKGKHSEVISNYEQVRKTLEDTQFASLLG